MWSKENNKVRLNIKKVRSNFRVVSQDGLHFVYPKKNVWDWGDDEKWLRSIVVDDLGFVVSSGWPKFGNYSEFVTDTEILNRALENNEEVKFSNKEDGSLCIRSVIGGKVVFRTRGTLYGGDRKEEEEESFGERFARVAVNKYPKLLDPLWMPNKSLLFEYVAPDNFIVIRYKEEDLVFIGAVDHSSLSICKWAEVEKMSADGELNLVKLHTLPSNPLEIIEEINTWSDEGIVARCNDDQTFVKIKSASYLANHRMRFGLRYEIIVEFILIGNVQDEVQFVKMLRDCNYDWEIIEEAKKFYQQYLIACKHKDDFLKTAEELYNRFWENNNIEDKTNPLVRKEFAKFACVQKGYLRPMMFLLYDGRKDKLSNLCQKIVLVEGKNIKGE